MVEIYQVSHVFEILRKVNTLDMVAEGWQASLALVKWTESLVFISGFMNYFRLKFLDGATMEYILKVSRQRGQTLYVSGYHDFYNKKLPRGWFVENC